MIFYCLVWAFLGAVGVLAFLDKLGGLELYFTDKAWTNFLNELKSLHPVTYLIVFVLGGPFVWIISAIAGIVFIVSLLFEILVAAGKKLKK